MTNFKPGDRVKLNATDKKTKCGVTGIVDSVLRYSLLTVKLDDPRDDPHGHTGWDGRVGYVTYRFEYWDKINDRFYVGQLVKYVANGRKVIITPDREGHTGIVTALRPDYRYKEMVAEVDWQQPRLLSDGTRLHKEPVFTYNLQPVNKSSSWRVEEVSKLVDGDLDKLSEFLLEWRDEVNIQIYNERKSNGRS